MGQIFHVLSVVLVLGSLSWEASATRTLNDYPVVDSFGEDWIKQFGYEVRTFRFYLAQKSAGFWPKKATPAVLGPRRAQFQADMQAVLASYLDILSVRIRFPSDQQPDRSPLISQSPYAKDVRSFIDVTIEYPRPSPFATYPKDITSTSSWLLGADGDTTFMARWDIGLSLCDPLDPDYAFTNPFPGPVKCPLCNRVVEVFAPPTPLPQVTYALTLEVLYDSIVNPAATGRRLLQGGLSLLDEFKTRFENDVTAALLAQFSNSKPGAISVHVLDVEADAAGKMVVHFTVDIENEDLATAALGYIQDCAANNITGLLSSSFCNEFGVATIPGCPVIPGFVAYLRGLNHLNDTTRSLGNLTLEQYAADCAADQYCAGFDGLGNIKSSVVNVTQDTNTTMCLYVRNVTWTACPAVTGYNATRGYSTSGVTTLEYGSNSNLGLDNIAGLCTSDFYCSGFVATGYEGSSNYDYTVFKGVGTPYDAYNNYTCIYTKFTPTSCPTVPGYVLYDGTISGTPVGTQQDSCGTQAMGTACTNYGAPAGVYSNCTAFDNTGNLYDSTAVLTPGSNNGTCYYVQACPQVYGYSVYNGTITATAVQTIPYYDVPTMAGNCTYTVSPSACTAFDTMGNLYSSPASSDFHAGTWPNGTLYNIGDGGECFYTQW